jgi:hypothetical protein
VAASGEASVLHLDSELVGADEIVRLYAEHGDGFASRVRGGFAVAVGEPARVVLARDRFGAKPLVYRRGAHGLEVASDARAFAPAELDHDALDAFLAHGSIPAPLSILRGVRTLPPGHLLVWEDGNERLEPYVRRPAQDVAREDRAELVEELRARLRDAVRARLGADTGVLLSGGLHSATIAALAAQEATAPLRTFSVAFSSGELSAARSVATRWGAQHRELVVRPDESLLRAFAEACGEPVAPVSAFVAFLAARLAAEDVDTALSGLGGAAVLGSAACRGPAVAPAGLDLRLPFLDTVVSNLALVPGRATRALLREAAAPLLPRAALRGGDPAPHAGEWLRGELAGFTRETLARHGQPDPSEVARLLDEHASRRADHGRRLWALLALALWRERHVDGKAAP